MNQSARLSNNPLKKDKHSFPRPWAGILAFLFSLLFLAPPPVLALTPSDLIVVYNTNMAGSRETAEYYARKRKVPASNLMGVDVPVSEDILRERFQEKMVIPLRAKVKELRAGGKDPAILLVYGIPILVRDSKGRLPQQSIRPLLKEKIEEYEKIVKGLNGQLDRLTGSPAPETGTTTPPSDKDAAIELIEHSGRAFSRALQQLAEKQGHDQSQDGKAKILSLMIRLGGTGPVVRRLAARAARGEEKDMQLLQNQELFRWDTILRQERLERSFHGTPPGTALETATIERFLGGVIGELRFWYDLDETYAKGQSSASVDSELTLLAVDAYQIPGWLPNPFHERYDKVPPIERSRQETVRVGRLDGPSAAHAKRLVDDAMAAEETGLEGTFYIDARGLDQKDRKDAYALYDRHLLNLHAMLEKQASMKVVINREPEVFQAGSCPDAALYCGWYSRGRYVDAFSWQKGSVGFHVASSEASTLRQKGSNVWCKRMIEEGVAGTLGPVREPYLTSFPLPDHFFPLLMSGRFPILDVYFRSSPFTSWRQILIADPLYNPFRKRPAIRFPETKIPQAPGPFRDDPSS